MNKYQDALNNLVHCKSETKCKECRHKDRCTMDRDYKILKELVDKETPIKPKNLKEKVVFESITKREWICPRCKHEYIGNPKIEYCCMCGQHIDWSDTNETY